MSLLTRTEYNSNITTYIPDNTNRLISEQDVRDRFVEAKDSFLSMVSGFDLLEYSNVTTYQIGDCITFNNLIYRKINNPNVGIDPSDVMEWELLGSTPFSSESKWGITKKASFVEFTGGTEDNKYVTPFQIASLNIPQVLDDLLDVDIASPPNNGQTIVYDSTSQTFYNDDLLTIAPASLSYLSFNPSTRELSYNPSAFVETLDDLTDVIATAPSIGQSIFWNGSNYTLNYSVIIDANSINYLDFDEVTNTLSFNDFYLLDTLRIQFNTTDPITGQTTEFVGSPIFYSACYDVDYVFDGVSFEARLNSDAPSAFTPLADLTALNLWVTSNVVGTVYWQLNVLVDFKMAWSGYGHVILKHSKDSCIIP